MARWTTLLFSGPESIVEGAFDKLAEDGTIDLPDVMSREKQVAPVLMAAAGGG